MVGAYLRRGRTVEEGTKCWAGRAAHARVEGAGQARIQESGERKWEEENAGGRRRGGPCSALPNAAAAKPGGSGTTTEIRQDSSVLAARFNRVRRSFKQPQLPEFHNLYCVCLTRHKRTRLEARKGSPFLTFVFCFLLPDPTGPYK